MPTTLDRDSELLSQTKAKIEASTARLLHLLSFVPEDRLNWSPSPTSKSALRLITHCARSDRFFVQVIPGTMPDEMPTPDAFFGELHAADPTVVTREDAIALLRSSTAELLAVLGSVEAPLDTPRQSPVGAYPMGFWIDAAVDHRATHVGQLEYLQTVWGDLDNHMG